MGNTVTTSQSISSITLARLRPVRRKILVYLPEYDDPKIDNPLIFGPNYMTKADVFWEQEKKKVLSHVLRNSNRTYDELMNEIGSVEVEARAAYSDDTMSKITNTDFLDTMVRDGCFFLVIGFSILGARSELKFSDNHLLFGIGGAAKHLTWWLKSIFLVGNQVPLTVLKKLMNYLRFFQELKANQWINLPLDGDDHLSNRTIHKFLMSEAGQEDDIIHCLRSVILGTNTTTVPQMHQGILEEEVIHSALLLSKKGVHFEKLEGECGVRRIHYKPSKLFNPVLYLPSFLVDEHTDLIVKCVVKYEEIYCWDGEIEPEASSYFKLLKVLIPTTQDLEILYSSGVIRGQPDRLRRLLLDSSFQLTGTSTHLCRVRQQIKEDTHHRLLLWRKLLKGVCAVFTFFMLLLAFLQALYAILPYYRNLH